MAQIHGWIAENINEEFPDFCKYLIKDFVYSQHLRIGMSRLGEDGTRLRFSLGDHGISPAAKLENFALAKPPFMADRLHALIDFMEDLEYTERDGELISGGYNTVNGKFGKNCRKKTYAYNAPQGNNFFTL